MYFFVRTQYPRPTFHLDMTEAERALMQRHVAKRTQKAEAGIAIAFGPVMDPRGVYGIGIYDARDAADMQGMLDADPAKDLLGYETYPMPRVVVGRH